MKDIFKRLIISVVSGLYIGYMIFLFTGGNMIVNSGYEQFNMWYYLILIVVLLVLFIFFGIYPVHFRMTKGTLFVIGIFLILVGNGVLLNDALKGIYVGDLFQILGVVLTLLAWTNVLITSKIIKKSKDKNVEIIEV